MARRCHVVRGGRAARGSGAAAAVVPRCILPAFGTDPMPSEVPLIEFAPAPIDQAHLAAGAA